jgi:hypothetical protein
MRENALDSNEGILVHKLTVGYTHVNQVKRSLINRELRNKVVHHKSGTSTIHEHSMSKSNTKNEDIHR